MMTMIVDNINWETQSWASRADIPGEYNVTLRLSAKGDSVGAWQWEDYNVFKVNYNFILLADGSTAILTKRIDAVDSDGDRIEWYGDYSKGDSTIFDKLADNALNDFFTTKSVIEFRRTMIAQKIAFDIEQCKERIASNQKYYGERIAEFREEMDDDNKEQEFAISELYKELAQLELKERA